MKSAPLLIIAAIILSGAAAAAPAAAAPVSASSSGTATLLGSLTVLKRSDLDFGSLMPTGAGTAVIDPYTGATSTTGPVTVGANGHAATFTTTGTKNSVVIVKLPNSATTLTLIGGGASMIVDNWTLDGSSNRKIPSTQTFDFSVGATLHIAAGQPDGTYAGTFTMTVNYP